MTEHAPENTQLFLTAPMPCPYLPGKMERKLFTHLTGRRAPALHALLSDNGFRRSQNLIYRPACEGCAACQSVRYLEARHTGGGMTAMNFVDYEYMVEDTPVQTVVVEYRMGSEPDKPLVAVALTDVMPDGLSMVYSFFAPELPKRGLGNLLILDHIRQVRLAGLSYVYLGYWVEESPKMAYKGSFRPLEVQRGPLGWRRLD